jgi:hypothetical protein
MKEKIMKILIEDLSYTEYIARVTAEDLLSIDERLMDGLNTWVESGIMKNYSVQSFSTDDFVLRKGFTYPAALIAIDWLLRDYFTAYQELTSFNGVEN